MVVSIVPDESEATKFMVLMVYCGPERALYIPLAFFSPNHGVSFHNAPEIAGVFEVILQDLNIMFQIQAAQ